MSISTLDGLIAAARQRLRLLKTAGATTVATAPFSLFDVAGSPGAGSLTIGQTTNGRVPTDAIAGFPTINAFGGGATGYLQSVEYGCSVACRITIYDRLFDVGSIVATSLATTTLASQPDFSGRLPVPTDFTGLELFAEINVAISNTATTIAVQYTKEDGTTTGRSTGAISIQNLTTRRLVPLPLQAGDKGIAKIEAVIIGGTVASAGSVNVVIGRRLWSGRMKIANDGGLDGPDATALPILFADSALWPVVEADSTSSGIPELALTVVNG